MSKLAIEQAKLNNMKMSNGSKPSEELLKQSQLVDKLIVEVMRLQLSKLRRN